MSGGGGSYTAGFRYLFGIHMGVCRGPVDELVEARVGDRTAWFGSVTQNQKVPVDAYNLFGGEDKEGGVQGDMWVLFGEDDQLAPDELANLVSGSGSGGSGPVNPLPAIVFPSSGTTGALGTGNATQSIGLNFMTTGQTQSLADGVATIDPALAWYSTAPVLPTVTDDYEVRFDVLGSFGSIAMTGSALGTWLPMTADRSIVMTATGQPSGNPWYAQLRITFRRGTVEGLPYERWFMIEEPYNYNPGGA